MKYRLEYYLMCGIDGSIDFEDKNTSDILASNDVEAIQTSNTFLRNRKIGSVIPWAPALYEGVRQVAKSDPAYPPHAHHLSWICQTRQLVAD